MSLLSHLLGGKGGEYKRQRVGREIDRFVKKWPADLLLDFVWEIMKRDEILADCIRDRLFRQHQFYREDGDCWVFPARRVSHELFLDKSTGHYQRLTK